MTLHIKESRSCTDLRVGNRRFVSYNRLMRSYGISISEYSVRHDCKNLSTNTRPATRLKSIRGVRLRAIGLGRADQNIHVRALISGSGQAVPFGEAETLTRTEAVSFCHTFVSQFVAPGPLVATKRSRCRNEWELDPSGRTVRVRSMQLIDSHDGTAAPFANTNATTLDHARKRNDQRLLRSQLTIFQ